LAQTPFEIDRRENLKKEFLSAFLNISPCNSELWKEYALTIKDEYFYSATIKKALLYYVPAKDGITLGDIYSDMAVHYSYSNIQLASALMAVAKHYGGVSFAAAFVLSKQNVVNMSFGQACEILKAARIQVGLSSLAERALSKINSSSTETPAKHESKECFPENGNENGLQVDLVLCLDCTGGMQYLIDLFIDNALTFVKDVTDSAEAQNNFISQFRVRIVAFRDYVADGNEAMLATDFFNLPEESEIFENVLRCLEAKGGGDDPEDGLEALAYAIRSKWEKNNGNARQIIAVFSDAPTHPLGLGSFSSRYYPKDMAKDFEELTQWWNSNIFISDKEKRLILFTVDGYDWSVISQNWENAVLFPVEGAEGCTELEYEDIVTAISNAI